jgi:hypothetical protein
LAAVEPRQGLAMQRLGRSDQLPDQHVCDVSDVSAEALVIVMLKVTRFAHSGWYYLG